MRWKSMLYVAAAALLFVCPWALAETDTPADQFKEEKKAVAHELEPVTVMATKTPKAPIDAPASVSVITEDEIQAFDSAHPFKPLMLTEGVWPRQYRGLADFWGRPMIRGYRALVQVDGVDWYDYGYYFDTAAIPMPDVERIDVVRGPFSALYGSLAQTGVINYTTKIPEEMSIHASASYGEWNSRYYTFRIADRPFGNLKGDGKLSSWLDTTLGDRFFYSFSFKSRTTDGYVTTPSFRSLGSPVSGELDPDIPIVQGWSKNIDPQTGGERFKVGDQGDNWYEDYGLFFKTGYDLGPNTRFWYSLNFSEYKYGWRDGRSYVTDPSGDTIYNGDVYVQDGGNTYLVSLNDSLFTSDPKKKKATVHTLHCQHSIPDVLDISGLFAFNDKESSTRYTGSSRYKVEDDALTQADLTATIHSFGDRCLVTVGVQGLREEATVTESNLSDAYDEHTITSLYQETTGKNLTLGSFVQVEFTPISRLTAYLGGRYDHWWGTDATYLNESGEDIKYPDMDDGKFSPKASLVYRLLENGTLRASYGEAFTAPSLYYRTAGYYWSGGGTISMADPNPDLGPTTNKSWEVGTEWEFWDKRLRFKLTYFENDFKDLIVNKSRTYTLDDGTQVTEKQRVNAEEAEVNGIETSIEALLPYNMKAGLFYAHNWSEYTKTDDPSKMGWEVEETPTDIFSFWLGYFGNWLDASMSYRYCDSRYDDEYAPYADNAYKGDDEYHVVDAKVTLRPMDHVGLSFSVNNLLDEEYYEYYAAPGRFWLATMSVDF